MKRKIVILLGLLAVFLLPLVPVAWAEGLLRAGAAPATVRNYPGASPCNTTLQACLSGSNAGDIINVAANTYITNQLVITKAIVLQGAGAGPSNTILQALGAQRVISIGANVAAGVTISNLRVMSGSLTTGTEGGAGIFAGAGTPLTVLNADVMSNTIAASLGESGGGILANAPITLVNVAFVNNQALFGAGGGLRAISTANITGGKFERNIAFNPGGALRVNGALTLTNVTVISNSVSSAGQDGGGIRADGGLFMLGGLVQNNVAADNGGGIFATNALISGTQIISNAGSNGGGVFVTGALAITDAFFNKNVARAGSGGSIYSQNGGITITLEGTSSVSLTVVSNSTAITHGGAIFAAGGVRLVGAVFVTGNKALNGEGGAIYANSVDDSSGNSVLLVVTFAGNTSLGNGGAIRALNDVRLLNSPLFQSNSAGGGTTADGGAIYADGAVFLSRGSSTGNTARNGGAVYGVGDVLFNVHDTGPNSAALDGGCGYSQSKVTYNSADAISCVAGRNGGAAFSPLNVTLSANGVGVFKLNRANNFGGLAFANVVVVRDATIFSNTANVGGALVATKTLDIAGSTITTNTAATAGGAAVAITGTGLITNSIFGSNRVTSTNGFGGAVWVTGTLNITNSTFLTNSVTLGPASQGGAIAAGGRLSLDGDTFQGNQAVTGAAVRGLADVFATNTSFAGNGGINDRLGGGIAALTVTVSSVTMTQNTVCCTNASGGAISATVANINNSVFIQNSSFISGGAVIATQVFITGSLFLSNTLSGGEGGAVWTRGGLITNTQFTANATNCCSGAAGGAVFALGQIKIFGSQFTGNVSNNGGALVLNGSQSEVHDSTFTNNFVDCCDGGGAIDALAFFPAIYNSTFTGNHVDCCDGGGAIRATDLLYVESSTFSNNSASGDGGAIKRFVGSNNTTFITASTFISNFSGTSGGAVFGKQADIENSTFISNHVAPFASGGALALFGNSFIGGNSFTDNRVEQPVGACSSGVGGAVFQDQAGSILMQSSSFTRNSATRGGALFAGSATIEMSAFSDNSALCLDSVTLSNIGSGGAVDARGFLSVKRSTFLRNSAGSVGGGAIAFLPFSANSLHVENSLFARNVATNTVFGAHGAAIVISQTTTTGQLFFNTFADQPRNSVSAIAVYSGSVSVVDNIISGHATGIERIAGTAFEDFNLFFDNTSNTTGGVTSGGSSLTANPLFAAPAQDNYHVGPGSAALDVGSNLGIVTDFDGDSRPFGSGFDIGFDEYTTVASVIYLPVITR